MANPTKTNALIDDLAPGMEVWSRDGQRLGTVKETWTDRFKLSVRFGRDYWLTARPLLFVDTNQRRVVMDFDKSEERRFQAPAPEPE